MEAPKYLDLHQLMNDYLAQRGLTLIHSKSEGYVNSFGIQVKPSLVVGGLTHIAARGLKKEIIPKSLERMIQTAIKLEANACEIGEDVNYPRRITSKDLRDGLQQLGKQIDQSLDQKNPIQERLPNPNEDLITFCPVQIYRI